MSRLRVVVDSVAVVAPESLGGPALVIGQGGAARSEAAPQEAVRFARVCEGAGHQTQAPLHLRTVLPHGFVRSLS